MKRFVKYVIALGIMTVMVVPVTSLAAETQSTTPVCLQKVSQSVNGAANPSLAQLSQYSNSKNFSNILNQVKAQNVKSVNFKCQKNDGKVNSLCQTGKDCKATNNFKATKNCAVTKDCALAKNCAATKNCTVATPGKAVAPVVKPPTAPTTTSQAPSTTTTQKPTAPTTTTPATASSLGSYESQVVAMVNQERAANGLAALKVNTKLASVAELKAEDLRDKNYFDHNSPTYGSPFDMMKQYGVTYTAAGENIAKGQKTPAAVMDGWMNSPGHKANIMNSSYTEIGVGYVTDSNGTTYWVQMFIRP